MNDAYEEALPCQDKLTLDTEKQAEAAATVALHQHDADVAPYHCQFCGLWHLKTVYKT